MSEELKAKRQAAQDFVAANLAECCADELEWQSTSLLKNGKLREAAALFSVIDKSYSIPMAQSETARQAMAFTASPSFQDRVQPWMLECFGQMIAGDREERNHRFLEEAVELVQSTGCSAHEAHQLVDYVYGRPVGEPKQEVGGVMVTLAALCLANGMDMHAAGEIELARIWTKVEAIRAKQAAKPKHSPLPVVPQPAQAQPEERFYFDHGQLHDRVTGQHLWTQDQYDEQRTGSYKDGYSDGAAGLPDLYDRSTVAQAQPVANAATIKAHNLLTSLWTDMSLRNLLRPDQERRIAAYMASAQPSPAQGDAKLIERLTHERDALGKAIADAALKAGIWNGEVALTGPHLIMFADDLAECAKAAQGDVLSQQADPEWPAGEREAWRIGRAVGIEEAAKYLDDIAARYIDEHAQIESDTGAIAWEFGSDGSDYHSVLVEEAEAIRALAENKGEQA